MYLQFDQFLKCARLRNEKSEDKNLSFPLNFFLGLEYGQRYLGEPVNEGAVLGGGGDDCTQTFLD